MIEKKCEVCDKVIQGYNPNHAEFLLRQHMLTHEYKKPKGESNIPEKSGGGTSEGK